MQGLRWHVDPWLCLTLALSTALGLYQINWGLPAHEHAWAVDSLEPKTVLGIARHSLGEWNSGWFYFKYPLAYPLSVAAVYAPYLGYQFLTGGLAHPSGQYPYGFQDPEGTLLVLALLGRGLNVLFTLGTVASAYGIGRRLFGIRSGRTAGWLVATSYPVVYYTHTMNVDACYLFWLFFALYCAIAASQTQNRVAWFALGVAAAMAVSTKEQAFGFLLPLPVLALAHRHGWRGMFRACTGPGARFMAVGAIGTAVLANNAIFNPLGVVARIAYLLGRPITAVDAPLKPVSFALFKGDLEVTYLFQLWDGMDSALGLPLAILAVVGGLAVLRAPRTATWLLLPALAYYYLSMRGQQLITMRYAMPFILLLVLLAAGLLGQMLDRSSKLRWNRLAVALTVFVCGLSLARGIELNLLLRNDSRYQAERWLEAHVPSGARGEIYQKTTYLPRVGPPLSFSAVPIRQRSVAKLEERRPDFIVLSSASWDSISHIWNPDWRTNQQLLKPIPEAVQLLDELSGGKLPYEIAARFHQKPLLLRPSITGLCPEITIYRRTTT